ncbi:MAG: hypothetical protein AB7V44_33705, partial [Pseudonocardia sp.]
MPKHGHRTTSTSFGALVVLLAVLASGCGGGSSSAPTAPASTPVEPADLFVAPDGPGAGICSVDLPCASIDEAYQVASAGDLIEIGAGRYPPQEIVASARPIDGDPVIVQPAEGADVRLAYLDIGEGAAGLEVRDVVTSGFYIRPGAADITLRGVRSRGGGTFITSGSRIRIIGGEITDVDSVDGLQVKSRDGADTTDLLIDGLTIRNVTRTQDPSAHVECIQFTSGVRVTIRNSRFVDCGTQGVFFKEALGGTIREVLVENNWFGRITGYNTLIFDAGVSEATARYNSFAQAPRLGHDTTSGIVAYGNAGVLSACVASTTYRDNVWSGVACGPGDIKADSRFVDAAGFDLRLRPDSPAIDHGDPADHPARDL